MGTWEGNSLQEYSSLQERCHILYECFSIQHFLIERYFVTKEHIAYTAYTACQIMLLQIGPNTGVLNLFACKV